jgi:hypothetical protein
VLSLNSISIFLILFIEEYKSKKSNKDKCWNSSYLSEALPKPEEGAGFVIITFVLKIIEIDFI